MIRVILWLPISLYSLLKVGTYLLSISITITTMNIIVNNFLIISDELLF
jgi:hypothetical protein